MKKISIIFVSLVGLMFMGCEAVNSFLALSVPQVVRNLCTTQEQAGAAIKLWGNMKPYDKEHMNLSQFEFAEEFCSGRHTTKESFIKAFAHDNDGYHKYTGLHHTHGTHRREGFNADYSKHRDSRYEDQSLEGYFNLRVFKDVFPDENHVCYIMHHNPNAYYQSIRLYDIHLQINPTRGKADLYYKEYDSTTRAFVSKRKFIDTRSTPTISKQRYTNSGYESGDFIQAFLKHSYENQSNDYRKDAIIFDSYDDPQNTRYEINFNRVTTFSFNPSDLSIKNYNPDNRIRKFNCADVREEPGQTSPPTTTEE